MTMGNGTPRRIFYFDRRDHELLHIVNDVLTKDKTHVQAQRLYFPHLHPRGIKEKAESRGLRIAYAIVHLLDSLEVGKKDERLNALRTLREEVLNTSASPLKMNTARVLIQIMKDLVRAHGDYEKQLCLAHDFRQAACGKPRYVRYYLRRYHLLEMPEEWNQVAFDDHVHDANTKGRKSSTHLIMDAWIKGLRRLRVIFYNFIRPSAAEELMEAAEIMGLTIRIGIEFPTTFYNRFAHIIWVPRGFTNAKDFIQFLAREPVQVFMQKGQQVAEYQKNHVIDVLHEFNRTHLDSIRTRFGIDIAPLDADDFIRFVGGGQASLVHLAEYIHEKVRPPIEKRIAGIRTRTESSDPDAEKKRIELIDEMDQLDSMEIHDRFLIPSRNPNLPDIAGFCAVNRPELMKLSPFDLVEHLAGLHSGFRITLNLSNLAIEDVLEILYECRGRITRLEIFNLKDFVKGHFDHIEPISRLQHALNTGDVIALKKMIREIICGLRLSTSENREERIARFTEMLNHISILQTMHKITPLKSRIGSDSTSRSARQPGMGFAAIETLPYRARRMIRRWKTFGHLRIPVWMDAYLRTTRIPDNGIHPKEILKIFGYLRKIPGLRFLGFRKNRDWLALEDATRITDAGNIVALGGMTKTSSRDIAPLGEKNSKKIINFKSLRYMNTWIKNSLKILAGFVPAFLTFYWTHEWSILVYGGAFIWFGITGLRNILQSVLGGGGIRRSPMLRWNDYVNWERLTDSLMYTGFSVPLLDYFVKTLFLDRWLGINTGNNPFALYAVMGLANGLYLTSHNLFRGLPREAAMVNFFRSLLAIPVAIVFNAVLGNVLSLFLVADIDRILQNWAAVISKAASDCIAGILEGAIDRAYNIRDRLSDYKQKVSQLFDIYTRLEMIYSDSDLCELLERPKVLINESEPEVRGLMTVMVIHSLDLLYFWYYQPRARNAFRLLYGTMPEEERKIFLRVQELLNLQKEISMLFIDGLVGRNFSKALSFYLERSGSYLKSLHRFLPAPAENVECGSDDPGAVI